MWTVSLGGQEFLQRIYKKKENQLKKDEYKNINLHKCISKHVLFYFRNSCMHEKELGLYSNKILYF